MYDIDTTHKFDKSFEKISKNNKKDFEKILSVIEILRNFGVNGIPIGMKPHKLKGTKKDLWDVHVRGDLLILFFQVDEENRITLVNVGTHSSLGL